MPKNNIDLNKISTRLNSTREVMSLTDYLELAKKDSSVYLNAHGRLLKAIGEPELVDTSDIRKLGRIFGNKVIKRYKTFEEFYGMESVIEDLVSYLKHAQQGLEERKQILYFLGPAGSAKSSLADRLKELMEQEPIYVLAVEKDGELALSPIHETPLGLFSPEHAEALGIPAYVLKSLPSPWAMKRSKELGDISKFKVVKIYPSKLHQVAIAKTEPGDDNNQDISSLVGKLDIRKLQFFSQSDPDAYSYTGGLCIANQGILDFVEMFKAPIKVLNPLLSATQEGNYNATEALTPLPFDGLIVAHSNEAEWDTFCKNKNNEAFLDRICLVRVPYVMRTSEEKKIYQKLIRNSSLDTAPVVDHTLDLLSNFSVLTRLHTVEVDDNVVKSQLVMKMKVYDGDDVKNQYPKAKSFEEYKDILNQEGIKEGFKGFSTRAAFKILSKVYNYDVHEIAADPINLITILRHYTETLDGDTTTRELWQEIVEYLEGDYFLRFGEDLQTSYIESYREFGQHLFDKYVQYAKFWLDDSDFRDSETGTLLDRDDLNEELEVIEKKADIINPKDFRQEVVRFCLNYRAENGKSVPWTSYRKLYDVIKKNLFKDVSKILGQISFDRNLDSKEKANQKRFITEMAKKGYTERQTRRNVDWYERYSKSK